MLQRVWGWRYGLLQVLVVLSSAVSGDSLYRLVPPEVYVVFGGDLEVVFHIPDDVSLPNAFVRLRGQRPRDDTWVEITTMGGLPHSRKTGTLTAACGLVEFAGRYSLTMFLQVDGPVLTEVTFQAIWPPVVLRLPRSHTALTSAVTLEIDSRARCASLLHREFLTLELHFQRIEDTGSTFGKLSAAELISERNLTSVIAVADDDDDDEEEKDGGRKRRVSYVSYPCELFDLDGSYQVLLRSSAGVKAVAVSNVMTLTFSASYHLSSWRASVFPCRLNATLDVLYTHAPCSGVDRFRLYRLVREAPGSAASPLKRVYVAEFPTDPDRTVMAFNCSLFQQQQEEEEGEAAGYCFVYITVSRSGAVVEQKQLCLPSQPGAVLPQDGDWSPWTVWTACSVTCGSGKRSRFRMCNSPAPADGGRYCKGQAVQWSHCQVTCADALPRTPLRSPRFDPRCYCGCTRTTDSGEIIASGRCKGLATWIIKTAPGQRLTLTFRYYDISYERQWVKVRDGEEESGELLFFSHDQSQPREVTTSGNVMRVELMTVFLVMSPAEMTVFPLNASLPIHVHGFIASYEATALDAALLPPPLFRHVEPSVMDSGVTIAGIVVCSVVVVAVVAFAVVQRVYWRRIPKYSVANNEESPAHMVHSSSAQSSQPSSPGPQVQVDMDIPLTGGSGARRKSSSGQRAASRASSISSTCSAGLKKIRSRAENSAAGGSDSLGGGGGGGTVGMNGSPKPSAKDYSSLGSPYSNNASPEDHVHDPNFFRASPILKQVTPRSPKVHPHRLKASSPGTPGSPLPSPSITKHELLTRKRQERKAATPTPAGEAEGEREVTGSSGSSSAAKPTAAAPTATTTTTTKAEINLTKPTSSSTRLRSPTDAKAVKSGSGWQLRAPPTDFKPASNRAGAGKKRHSQGDRSPSSSSTTATAAAAEEIPLIDSTEDLHQPHQHPLKAEPEGTPVCEEEETSFIYPRTKARRPTSLTESYSIETIDSRGNGAKSRTPRSPAPPPGKRSAMEERQTLLPKPDGQSPKSPREELVGSEDREEEKTSRSSSSPSKSSLSGKSNKTLSPTRSIATPELEYDDFIMDDPLSYFEYEDLSRLNWSGTEKIGSRTKSSREK